MSFSLAKFQQEDCAICLSPLSNGENVLELACGHQWHTKCITEQLEHAQPSFSRRLLFSGCRCAICGAFCEHEELEHLTRTTDSLREKVDELIAEQLQVDVPEVWKKHETVSSKEKAKLIEEGRRTYAFYLCSSCREPYFGGTIECADQDEGERIASEDRLCSSCSSQSQTHCVSPLGHRASLVWKCRYCCAVSNFVCYGTVHFCQDCHDRNTQRYRNTSAKPPPLEAIPCPGGEKCQHPKPDGQTHHDNGPGPNCEQVYQCVSCVTGGRDPNQPLAFLEQPGSHNFIVNQSGEDGLLGWVPISIGGRRPRMWSVEESSDPVRAGTTTNFVSSCTWCSMGQVVPLSALVREPSAVRIEVSAKYMGRTDCPSVFQLVALARDASSRILFRADTGILSSPADAWERASLVLEPQQGIHDVVLIVLGKDSNFWAGNYGSKVAECSVRVLCPVEDLRLVLL